MRQFPLPLVHAIMPPLPAKRLPRYRPPTEALDEDDITIKVGHDDNSLMLAKAYQHFKTLS